MKRNATMKLSLWGVCLVLIVASGHTPVLAAKYWDATGSGQWETGSNWNPATAPESSDGIIINNAIASKTVTIDATTAGSYPGTMSISSLSVNGSGSYSNTLSLSGSGTGMPLVVSGVAYVAQADNETAGVILDDAALTCTGGTIGYGAGATGRLTVQNGSSFVANGNFNVGSISAGAVGYMSVLDGSTADVTGLFYIGGNVAGCTGTVHVGASSSISCVGAPQVGRFGEGTLLITTGGMFSSSLAGTDMFMGRYANSSGSLIVDGGTLSIAAYVSAGSAGKGTALITNGGMVETLEGLTAGNVAGSGMTNEGGIFQFKNDVTPTITPGTANGITLKNGTISYTGVTAANVTYSQLNNITYLGNNAFRLNNASNTASVAQSYVFDPLLGPSHYYRLEMINGGTRYQGQAGNTLTIGSSLGSGGEMLCSNTTAGVGLTFTNNGTLTIANSKLTFDLAATLNGNVVIDLDNLATTNGVVAALGNLTLGGASTLTLMGGPVNADLFTYAGTLVGGMFNSVVGLPPNSTLDYGTGSNSRIRISVPPEPTGTIITIR